MHTIESVLVYAVQLGSLYLLISLGFSLTCGVLGIFNLGYSATFLVAIYGIWMFIHDFGFKLLPAIIVVFLLQALFTLGIIYYPVVKRFMEKEEILLTSLLVISLIWDKLRVSLNEEGGYG